jgi:ferredoxin
MKLLITIFFLCVDLLVVVAFTPGAAYRTSLSPLFESKELTTGTEDVVSLSLSKPLGIVLEENEENESKGVFVLEVGDSGSAAPYADQIAGCKLLSVQGVDMTKSSFDEVMDAIVGAPETVELKFEAKMEPSYAVGTIVKIVAEQKDKEDLVFEAKVGDNLRQALLDNGFEVYQGMKQKLGNCGGGGTCTFCAMDFVESDGWEERSEYEDRKLAKNPNARLACLNPIQGPVKLRKASR